MITDINQIYINAAPVLCSAILALGFDEKFIRIWEYYFIYCAAGFKSRTLGNYQVRVQLRLFMELYQQQA
jgi:hypothetical protein